MLFKIYSTMKNLILFLLTLACFSCKKEEQVKINKLIYGLDPNVTLPRADTTNAFSYFQGYIDGEYFSVVHDKDSFQMIDVASYIYGNDYKKEWFQYFPDGGAISPLWIFQQPETREKKWYISFNLPAYSSKKGESNFLSFKRKYTTPATFTNLAYRIDSSSFENFSLQINRTDIYDGKLNNIGVASWGDIAKGKPIDQTGSYIKLISVRYVDYIPNTSYHYEMIYEFDLKLLGGGATEPSILHLTKGRMKTWLVNIKL
jgi:hypothetical protein